MPGSGSTTADPFDAGVDADAGTGEVDAGVAAAEPTAAAEGLALAGLGPEDTGSEDVAGTPPVVDVAGLRAPS